MRMLCNNAHFYGEFLAPLPTPKLEDLLLVVVHGCLFNIFAATLQIGDRSSIRNLKTCHAIVGLVYHGQIRCSKIKRIVLFKAYENFIICQLMFSNSE